MRTIDATECSTTSEFLRTLSAALDFPDGDVNWNVVEERLYDMTWYPGADAYVIVILNCEKFESAQSARDLARLDGILSGIVDDYRTAARQLEPRRFVCQCSPSSSDRFGEMLLRLGVQWPPAPMS